MGQEISRQELLQLLFNVKPEIKGRGPMSDATRQLLSEDFIDVEMDVDGVHWNARLTSKGEKRLSALLAQ